MQSRLNENEQQIEYYVHYDGYNKRLDEWVLRERIISSNVSISTNGKVSGLDKELLGATVISRGLSNDLLSDNPDRKITRNQKRKHDEINHVQKT